MDIDIKSLIGETTCYDKKEQIERNKPKSWLKSVSAFANGDGGSLIFGISDNDVIKGLVNAQEDAEFISEVIKTKLDPVPVVNLEFKVVEDKKLIVLHIYSGQETPYYYIGDKQRLAYVRIGNESTVADRSQLKSLVMKGAGRTYDSLPSVYKFEDMAFSKLKSVHFRRLQRSFEDSEFISWGIVDESGVLTNAGALLADDSPIKQSRIFCTRWNGLNMTNGLNEAADDVELEGSIISQLQDAVSFVRNNSHKKWWKEGDYREELSDYPERAVMETIVNAIIHRDYMQTGSEVHLDMYDNRIEVYSPGGMIDGRLVQELNPLAVPSKRRNPMLADFFNRLGLMERRGSGMKKIIDSYKNFEDCVGYRMPEFTSNASEFHVTLWNINYNSNVLNDMSYSNTKESDEFVKEEKQFVKENNEFVKEQKEFVKEPNKFVKEFAKISRLIYKQISQNPKINATQIAEVLEISPRQVQKYMKRLQELNKITRVGGRKMGEWKIIDVDYENFFDRI